MPYIDVCIVVAVAVRTPVAARVGRVALTFYTRALYIQRTAYSKKVGTYLKLLRAVTM